MITEQQQANLARAHSNKKLQDKKTPFVINMDDGRLIPNTPGNARLKNYRPYTGSTEATEAERVQWLRSAAPYRPRKVVDTTEEEPFDLATATKEQLLDFARADLGMTDVDSGTDVRTLRKQIKARWEAQNGPLS